MENISIEQIIKVNPPKYVKVLKPVMVVLCVFSLAFILTIFGIFLTVGLIFLTVVVFHYYDAEYEYTLVEKELTIERIVAKSYRRKCGEYNLSRMEIMAPLGSDKLARSENGDFKTYDYSSNTDRSKTYVLFAPCNNEMVRLIFEPDERMKQTIWRTSPSKVNL